MAHITKSNKNSRASKNNHSELSSSNIITRGTRHRSNINYNETALSKAALRGTISKKKGRMSSKNTLEKRNGSTTLRKN